MRYVALLRGINVGRANRVAMADLKRVVEELGYGEVKTLLNSGNVVFSGEPAAAASVAVRIESALKSELGLVSRVVVIAGDDLDAAIAGNPFDHATKEPARFLLAVLMHSADAARLEPLTTLDWGIESFAVSDRVAYLWCADGLVESKLAQAVGRALRDGVTTRNWATVLKIQALIAQSR